MSELPQGWVETPLEGCIDILDNQRIPVNSHQRQQRQGDIPYYGATGQVGWIDDHIFDEEILLVGEDGAPFLDMYANKAYIIKGKSWVNNHAHVLRAITEVTSNTYLRHFLNFFDYHGYVNGTTRLKLTQASLRAIPVFLPPLPEQRRIVVKLEQVLARVDACRSQLAQVPTILKRYRQSVLAAACSGRLTEDWREEIDEDDQGIPSTWQQVQVGDLLESLSYGTSVRCSYDPIGVPVLRIPNVCEGRVSQDNLKYGELSESEKVKLALLPGDILMVRSNGSVSLVGRTAIMTQTEQGFCYAGYLVRLRTKHEILIPEYLHLSLSSSDIRDQIEIPARSTSGVNNINSTEIKRLSMLLPPLKEQQEIVRRVTALFALADQVETRYAQAKTHVDRLTQSIFAKAFRGELVTQDPADEPASVLLERIQATTATTGRRKSSDNHRRN